MVRETGALVWPVMLRNWAKTVFCPPPLLSWNAVRLVKGAKKTAVKVESSLRRIESAVRQAKRRLIDWLPTWVTLLTVPTAGVRSGSPVRNPERSTEPWSWASMSEAVALPHQLDVALKASPP